MNNEDDQRMAGVVCCRAKEMGANVIVAGGFSVSWIPCLNP